MSRKRGAVGGSSLACVAAAFVAAVGLAADAGAAFPGANGQLAYVRPSSCFDVRAFCGQTRIRTVAPNGTKRSSVTRPGGRLDSDPAWSPNGQRIAFSRHLGRPQLHIVNADGSGLRRLAAKGREPAWSPDGRKIVYRTVSPRTFYKIKVIRADGKGRPKTLNFNGSAPAWSPNGTHIAYVRDDSIWLMRSDGTERVRLTDNSAREDYPEWSPDGEQIAFNRSDRIWTMAADGGDQQLVPNTRRVVSDFAWSPNGRWFAYNSPSAIGQIFLIRADGTGRKRITPRKGRATSPAWQPLPR